MAEKNQAVTVEAVMEFLRTRLLTHQPAAVEEAGKSPDELIYVPMISRPTKAQVAKEIRQRAAQVSRDAALNRAIDFMRRPG